MDSQTWEQKTERPDKTPCMVDPISNMKWENQIMTSTHLSALAFLLSSSRGSTLEAGANLASRAFFFASSSAAVVGLGIPNLLSTISNSVHFHSQ